MEDFVPKPGAVKIGGLGRAAQKLQAAREKAAHAKNGTRPDSSSAHDQFKSKGPMAGSRKTSFQRKSV